MKTEAFSFRATTLTLLASLALAGCAVGPDFKRPESSTPDIFQRLQSAQSDSRAVDTEFHDDWWTLLNDPMLNELQARLAESNLDVAAAATRLGQSRATQQIVSAAQLPKFDGAASYYRERGSPTGILSLLGVAPNATQTQSASGGSPTGVAPMPGSSGSPPYDVWQMGIDASWEIDIWGRVRRSVEAVGALTDASFEDRNAVLLSVRAELARDYVELRDIQSLLEIAQQNLEIARDAARLTQVRAREGVTTDLDVANATAQVASIESLIPTLEARHDATINAIGLLLAQEPGALKQQLAEPRAMPALPARVPVGLPSEIVQRRPDIRRAEAQLHAATASIGMAKADFYPRIMLNGSAGFQSLQLSSLADWASRQFVVGPSISIPIFEGGRLKGTLRLREAQQQEAAIDYRHTVLKAWREVDDALVAYDAEQRRRDKLVTVVSENQRALSIAQQRYKAGAVDYLDVLNVQRQLLQAQRNLEESRAAAATNLIVLCKVLGGGWESTYGNGGTASVASTAGSANTAH
ncbi:efflux transporter outer membrane subunit [Cupriavidus pauculus]|uniref:efflux transporter outer membrane subunit n=1 Tax=Cupriavidus pauculus TaxID=82633 RepID=UPI001EE3514A|nr:efflux transporter outer membrane subunit [Cupriavidus pauculus]GJG98628.1 efflux transporter outer membrane subunit [Cupriavidus pauculus]